MRDDEFLDLTPEEERLLELFVQYDEALADDTCHPGSTPTPADLEPEAAQKFHEILRVLELLASMRKLDAQDQPSLFGPTAQATDSAAWIDGFETVLRILGNRGAELPRQLGRFVVLRELGRGGHGLVLLAHDPILKRHVALKLPRLEALLSRVRRRRFLREAQAAARLTHPNLVAVYEVGEVGPLCYIASSYCAGPTLSEWLKKHDGPVAPLLAAHIVEQLAQALSYAHDQKILHRDLKPSNILLEPVIGDERETDAAADERLWEFVPKVTDFGLAKIGGEDADGTATNSGRPLGTPAYMSPEQAAGKSVDVGRATDVYALGAILYELLAGVPVFRGATDLEILHKVRDEDPTPLRRMRHDLPADLEAICLKCLEKTPQARYTTCAALADDLRRFLAAMPTEARPLSAAQRVARWAGRNQSVAALLATIMVLLLAISSIATVSAIRVGHARDEAERIAVLEREAREEAHRSLVAEQKSIVVVKRAEHQAELARETAEAAATTSAQISDYLAELFLAADPIGTGRLGFRLGDEIGQQLTLRELLDRGVQRARHAFQDQPQTRAKLLDTLGKVYNSLGEMDRAEPLLREAYAMRSQHPEQEADLASSLLNMGVMLRWRGEYAESEVFLRRALELRQRLFGTDDLSVVEVEFALAWALFETERFGEMLGAEREAECEELIRHTLEVQRRQLGKSHRDVGLTLSVYTLFLYFSDRSDEAQRMAIETAGVVMQQEGGQALGRGLLEYQRAAMSRSKRRFDEAEKEYRASLRTIGVVLGEAHPVKILVLRELAGMLSGLGRMDDAEIVAREALDIGFRVFPQGHPQLTNLLVRGAEVIEAQGKYEEAISLIERRGIIGERYKRLPVAERIESKLQIAGFRLNQGRLDDAAILWDEVQQDLASSTEESGANDSAQARHHWLEGCLAGARGQHDEQERIGRECLMTVKNDKEFRKGVEIELAILIHTLRPGDPEAEQLLGEPKVGWAESLEPGKPQRVLRHLARVQLLVENGALDEAQTLLRLAHEFAHQKTISGSYFRGLADSLMGQLLAAQGQQSEAEQYLLAGWENLRVSRGETHRLTHEAAARLAQFYEQTGRAGEAKQ